MTARIQWEGIYFACSSDGAVGYLRGTATNLAGRSQYHFMTKREGNVMNLPKAHSDTYGYGPRQQTAYSPTMRRREMDSANSSEWHPKFIQMYIQLGTCHLLWFVVALLGLLHRNTVSFHKEESRGGVQSSFRRSPIVDVSLVAAALLNLLHRNTVLVSLDWGDRSGERVGIPIGDMTFATALLSLLHSDIVMY
eukprot:scaffold29810_cov94-Skeletonema_dohrnii-CCMP3373.AAC.2